MKVFVTGGTGYIGRWLCRALAGRGCRVSALSRNLDETMDSVAEWIAGDLSDVERLHRGMAGCELVFHLACMPMGSSEREAAASFHVNALGTANLLQAAVDAGISGVVYTSTGQVYGGCQNLPNREDRLPDPGGTYAAGKYCAEIWCQTIAVKYRLPVTTLRLFNVYGPAVGGGLARRTVENIFIERLLQGERPLVTGSPLSGRDFVFVDDVIRALLQAADSLDGYRLFNVGSGLLTTLPDLARLAASVVGVSVEPEIRNDEQLPPMRFQADIERARDDLGFTASVALRDGLQKLVPG